MKLIKLTDVCCGDTLYINSNCILSCEHKYHNESETWYTRVGLLYENAFEFWYVKETIEEIQSQLEGNPAKVYIDKHKVGKRIQAIRFAKRNGPETIFRYYSCNCVGVKQLGKRQQFTQQSTIKKYCRLSRNNSTEIARGVEI